MPMGLPHRIAIVGAGLIGSALAGHLILGGVAVLAIPNAAVASFAEVYRDRLAGAVIIDPSNPFVRHDDGVMTIKNLGDKASGMVTAELFPKSSVARAFSHQLG